VAQFVQRTVPCVGLFNTRRFISALERKSRVFLQFQEIEDVMGVTRNIYLACKVFIDIYVILNFDIVAHVMNRLN